MPTADLLEITRPRPTERIAGAPPFIRGVAIVRGERAIVVDSGVLLGGKPAKAERFVMIRAGGAAAIAVEALIGAESLSADRLIECPPLLGETKDDAVRALDADLVALLRTARRVPAETFERLKQPELAS